jgi:transmembrane sensor
MKYNYNQIQDFLNDDSFVQWVLFGKDDAEWEQFLLTHPSKQIIVNDARRLILELNVIEEKNVEELNQNKVWDKLRTIIDEEANAAKPELKLWKQPVFKWAASLMLMVGAVWLSLTYQSNGKVTYQALRESIEDKNIMVERVNNSDIPLKVRLEDGSVITLEKGSKMSYPRHFDNYKRTVILSGDAFFEITKNPEKPFYVYANEVVTKVLGTSFRIQAFENGESVIVKVKTGKVSVYNQHEININDPEDQALILLPNHQAIFNRSTEDLSKHLVEMPMPISVKTNDNLPTEFDDVAISKILEVIEKRYSVKVIFNEELLSNCYITTKLRNESIYDQLDLICKIIGGTYKEVDAQIVIESKGCK